MIGAFPLLTQAEPEAGGEDWGWLLSPNTRDGSPDSEKSHGGNISGISKSINCPKPWLMQSYGCPVLPFALPQCGEWLNLHL